MGFDVSYGAAALAGLISFLSPCVLPLVPAYLCFVAGTSLDKILNEDGIDKQMARRVAVSGFFFVLGFTTVFVMMGASASAINKLIFSHIDVIGKVAGAVIIIFGLHYMGVFKFAFLQREMRFNPEKSPVGMIGAYVIGLAFAFGWTPCVGPILATILTLAASSDSLGYGVSLLLVYSLGLGIPFMAAALAIEPFMRFLQRFRRHVHKIEIGAGLMLVATGLLIMTDSLSIIGFYILKAVPALGELG
jgi:cytochrome c-type biogenesis protein